MSDTPPPEPGTRHGPRWRRWLIALLAVLLVLVLLPVCTWWWASSDGSLRQGLQLAQRFLPAGQTLEFRDATGSITGGGSIDHLQWTMPGTDLTIDGLRLDWSLRQLFSHTLDVRTLEAGTVHVRLTPQPQSAPAEPFTMPADASLPITLTLPLAIGSLQIESVAEDGTSSTQVINDLQAQYRFDGIAHRLSIDSLRHGQSSARATVQLGAQDLALTATASASLRDLAADTPFAMQLDLRANGNLGGGDAASIDVKLDGTEITSADAGAELHAQADIHPFAGQPAQRVEIQFSRVNAHAFHDQAPRTDLHGGATLLPVADGQAATWDYTLELANDAPGAWDHQQLPLASLDANGRLDTTQLRIDAARAGLVGRTDAGTVTLTGAVPLQQPAGSTLQLQLQQLDLQPLMTTLPRTAISGTASLDPEALRADIRNGVPGPLDRDRLPLEQLQADIRITPASWRAEDVEWRIGEGTLTLQGDFNRETRDLDVHGELQRLPVREIHSRLAQGLVSELSGTLSARGNLQQAVEFQTDINGNAPSDSGAQALPRGPWEIRAVQASGNWSPDQLAIGNIHLDAFQARVDGSDIQVALPTLTAVKASAKASAPGLSLTADVAVPERSAEGNFTLQLTSAEQVLAWLQGLPWIGEHMPIEQARGTASLKADWHGDWRDWADGFVHPEAHPQLHLNASATAQDLDIQLAGTDGAAPPPLQVPQLDLQVQGNLASASVMVKGDVLARDIRTTLDVGMQMTQTADDSGAPLWSLLVDHLSAATTLPGQAQPWKLQVGDGLQLTAQTGAGIEFGASAGRATLSAPPDVPGADTPLQLDWQPLTWRRTADGATSLNSSGSIHGIQPAWLDVLLVENGLGPLAGAGLRSDLTASGDWDIRMTDRLDIRAHLKTDQGDLWLLAPPSGPGTAPAGADVPAGIRSMDMNMQSEGEAIALALDWDTARAGVITARLRTRLEQHEGSWALPDPAPLSGTVRAHLQDMGAWGFLTPPGWRVQGTLDADITLDGTVQDPELQGSITGSGLNIRSLLDGVDLHEGRLSAKLDGSRLDIDELVLQGGTGSHAYISGRSGNLTQPPNARGQMSASGMIDWSGVASAGPDESGIEMDFKATLQKMQVLVREDRQMTLSGDLSASLKKGQLKVGGDLNVDRATIMLPEVGASTLGDDVVVVRDSDALDEVVVGRLQPARPMELDIALDLGHDLALQGEGITTRLEGQLTIRNSAYGNDPVRIVGQVRTDQGRYRAWGQALNVETGVLAFNGPYDNPSLDLVAIRPDIEVRAGVMVSGTLQNPQARLFSDPDLPEAEKLSWVVLGRSPATTSADGSSMQKAALSLLAGQVGSGLASGLGLDEIGLTDEGVSVGKRIGDELYVTYVQGLSGAASTLYLFYDITRRLTVRGQTGDSSAVDLIYTITYD